MWHHFRSSHFQVRFLIGCSDKLADVDIRSMVIWAIWLGPGSDCSGSYMAPFTLTEYLFHLCWQRRIYSGTNVASVPGLPLKLELGTYLFELEGPTFFATWNNWQKMCLWMETEEGRIKDYSVSADKFLFEPPLTISDLHPPPPGREFLSGGEKHTLEGLHGHIRCTGPTICKSDSVCWYWFLWFFAAKMWIKCI